MQTNIQIRRLQKTDNKAIAQIIRSVLSEFNANKPGTVYFDPTTDDLYHLFKTEKSAYFIIEMDGEVAGGGGIFPTPGLPENCCELVKLYLLPVARGKGLGRKLIEKAVAAAKEFGYNKMYLESMPELQVAVGMYNKLGFKKLDHSMGNSGHSGCSIWMMKDL